MDELDAVLESLAAGELTTEEAREQLAAVGDISRVSEFARVDASQATRTGVPEVVDAERKSTTEVIGIGEELLDATGRAILTGVGDQARERLESLAEEAEWFQRSRTLVVREADYTTPVERGQITIVSAGTADIPTAQQAAVLAGEMGCTVETRYDVGVSSIGRLYAELETLRESDCVIVAAGREGALATVVAGLIDVPIIGLPVGTGTGLAGGGEAALMGMLQSCTYLSVVNIDAGFAAGAQAALIAD
jgi:NCAIR mutase (PurE)-related protein